jgi:hypothetical protein
MDGGNGGDYFFSVFSNTSLPFGPVTKENLDITCLVFDFSCWLGTGEMLGSVAQPVIALEGVPLIPPWQSDYPIDDTPSAPPVDTYPLTSLSVTMSSTQVQVRVSAGTPGLSYVVSVLASAGAASARRKQVDCFVTIEQPLNSSLVAAGDVPAVDPGDVVILVPSSGDTVAPGNANYVYINNSAVLAVLTIQLPSTTPPIGGVVDFVEISFHRPVTTLVVTDSLGATIADSPTSAYGPGAGLDFKYLSGLGWIYWK